jgi:hypothetical protein
MNLNDLNKRKLTKEEYKELENLVYNYKTKHEQGFIWSEQQELLKQFPDINMDKYFDVQKGITCQMSTDGLVIYHCDVLLSLICGLENREQTAEEWD